MKVKIKKQGKEKQFKLISKWSDVTLEKWLKLIEFSSKSKTKEARETIAALSDIPKKLIDELSLRDVAVMMGKISELQQEQDSYLKRIIEVDGKEYGFHPDLDDITLGEYADLETILKNDVEKNLPEAMAILYRPVTEKGENGAYTIAAYDGNIRIRAEQMKKMSAEQVQSALRFFFALGKGLLRTLPSVLMGQLKEMNQLLPQSPSQKSGRGSGFSIGSQEGK